jgi:regulator of protease activity HflC (stomatin/prohibitin superfamily)
MERNTQKNGLVNLLALLAVAGASYAAGRTGNSLAAQMASIVMGIGVLVAAVSWFQMRLYERERLEKLEFDELSRSAASSALFNAAETEVFPAQRSREQFERFFVPAFTALVFLLQAGFGILFWRSLQRYIPVPLQHAFTAPAVMLISALVAFLLGKFATTIARLENLRLLRPGASYLLFSAYLCLAVLLAIGVEWGLGIPRVDINVARAFCVVLILASVETLTNLILEIYRPRVKGKQERPVYESRLVSLLGQPEGIITTAAQTLDYQFGFKVSETWFVRFFMRAAAWLLWLQLGVLFASTCVVFIDAGEQGLLEHFGEPRPVLGPGAHFKWPWPIDHVYRYPTEQIQTFNIGFAPDPARAADKTVLWTVSHTKEENFLVANRDNAAAESLTNNPADPPNNDTGKRAPPVSLLTVSIPVQFQITNLVAWAYNNEDPSTLLQHIATREVVRYFVGVDFQDIMSRGRGEAAGVLRDRIQAEADRHQMGASIVFVGLQDIHPPVKVAPDYEKVVAAIHTREAAILSAEAEAIRTNALAGAQAFKTICEAQAERQRREVNALAQAALFTNQITAFHASPSVFMQRAYFQTFSRAVADARKYLLLSTNTSDVIMFDFSDKIRKDILDTIIAPTPKPAPSAQK